MICLHIRSVPAFYLAIGLLSLAVFCSCNTKMLDPKEELLRSLKGANVGGYYFAGKEDDDQVMASLTNSVVRKPITLETGATNLVLRYIRIKDKKTGATRTYKTGIVKTGTTLTLQVTDIATSEVVTKQTFPAPEPRKKIDPPGQPPTFNSLGDCISNFDCTTRGALQCEANRTCNAQFYDLDCCLSNGQCFSLLLVITPTTARCSLREVIPDFGFQFSE